MKVPFEYHSYVVDLEDGWYIAKPLDGESCEIRSRRLFRVMRAVDELWDALGEGCCSPHWLAADGPVDLDQTTNPPISKVVMMIVAVIGIATPIAMLMHQMVAQSEPAIVFTLAVMAVGLTYGTLPAIGVSMISMALYNLCVIPPQLAFQPITTEEVLYTVINVVLAMVLPYAFGSKPSGRSESGHTQGTVEPCC